MLVPLLGVLLIRNEADLRRDRSAASDIGVNALRRFCGWIAARMVEPSGPLQPDQRAASSAASR